jgi:hypothetical protein
MESPNEKYENKSKKELTDELKQIFAHIIITGGCTGIACVGIPDDEEANMMGDKTYCINTGTPCPLYDNCPVQLFGTDDPSVLRVTATEVLFTYYT